MTTEVRIPEDMWDEDDKTGSIVHWLYKDGSTVKEGDLIAEVLVEKVTLELTAPASGTLRIRVEPEVVVNKGDVVAVIE
ncbi:MAG: biotin/lipoyl-containing protein [Thermaurantiacus tibetensis]|uniref:biotin/lipoyl-containing protein n=1 Tax=Thermaurantiacus tibetensis TaxID=2759035 RepID=UPI0018900854|nr:lipoyl domain-containing protein [Thermaurantiacus tibetensis]